MNLSCHHHDRLCHAVASVPAQEEWVYQIALPCQLSPTEVGFFLNIRRGSIATVDLEVGGDLLICDCLPPSAPQRVQGLNRSAVATHPRTGQPALYSRYPLVGGFVPLGACGPDGTPHPHAGNGFGVAQVLTFPPDGVMKWSERERVDQYHCLELQQYAYDGKTFQVTASRLVDDADLLQGWTLTVPALRPAIADGNDLVMGFSGSRPGTGRQAGILRWQFQADAWQATEFTPVVDDQYEASLVRDNDGALLFTARGMPGPLENDVGLWRSTDGGRQWEELFQAKCVRAGTPVTLNRYNDDLLYFASNPHRVIDSRGNRPSSIEMRETLMIWPLDPQRRGLQEPIMLRDLATEFEPAPGSSIWRGDHPCGLSARLADGKVRHLVCYRVMASQECSSDQPVTDRTGTYIAEVDFGVAPSSPWDFA